MESRLRAVRPMLPLVQRQEGDYGKKGQKFRKTKCSPTINEVRVRVVLRR